VLRIQNAAGNSAVARLIQRAAAGDTVLARAPKAVSAPHKPVGLTLAEQNWDRATLAGHAEDAYDAGDYGHAAALYERIYELSPHGDVALRIAQCYDHLKDEKQAKHWRNLARGVDDTVPPVWYQQH
jgi:uncharacterized membrane-anchored protein